MDLRFDYYVKNPSLKLRNELVEAYLYIVDILVKKYLGKGVEYDDLYQVGALALVNAVDRFDPSRGYEFSSFATPTILGELKKYFRDKKWSLRVPRRLKELCFIINNAQSEYEEENHKAPTVQELAKMTGYKDEDIIEAQESSKAYNTFSLDKVVNSTDENDKYIFDKYLKFDDDEFSRVEIDELVNKILSEVNDVYKSIYHKRFVEQKSQMEVANELGISQMSVSRAERNIKEKLKEALR